MEEFCVLESIRVYRVFIIYYHMKKWLPYLHDLRTALRVLQCHWASFGCLY